MHTLTRNAGLAAVALTLSLGLSACGEDAVDSSAAADTQSQTTDESTPEALPSEEMNDDAMSAGDQTFGAGCKLIPANGAGSFNGMATEPVATEFPACAPASSDYRVRDLSVPWARRRYLLANGTICSPNTLRSL